MKKHATEERRKNALRAVVELTRERRSRDVFYSSVSISGRMLRYDGGMPLYPYYVHGWLRNYVSRGLVTRARIPSETGNKEYIGYRANLGHSALRKELG